MKCWNAVHPVLIFNIFCDDIGVYFVGDNVFGVVHISLTVNVVHNALDVLHPGFHFDIGDRGIQAVKHAVGGSLGVRSAAQAPVLLSARALFSVGSFGVTAVKHWNRIFHTLALSKVVLGQLQFVGSIYEIHDFGVIALHFHELRSCGNGMRVFLTHGFKLRGNLIFECNDMRINAGVDSSVHLRVFACLWVVVLSYLFNNIFKSIFKNIGKTI